MQKLRLSFVTSILAVVATAMLVVSSVAFAFADERIVIRGLILPGGMPAIAKKADARYIAWWLAPFTTARILRDQRRGKNIGQVKIVGHSLGANSALNMANTLAPKKVKVKIVVALDPTYRNTARSGRAIAVQSRDFRARRITGAENISRPDLSHMSMTRDPAVVRLSVGALR